MSVNPWRGEVEVVIDGHPHTLRLTLGALCWLEEELEAGSLVDLVERLEGGARRARDIFVVLRAGLLGGGVEMPLDTLVRAEFDGGLPRAAEAAAHLIARAFHWSAPT